MSPSSQSQALSYSTSPTLIPGPGREIHPPTSHHVPRIPFTSNLNALDNTPRLTFATPRSLDNPVNSMSSPTIYNPASNGMMFDQPSRSDLSQGMAPPFHETRVLFPLYGARGQQSQPDIQAKIHKSFFLVDSKWTCYRRNYFSVTCSLSLRPFQPNNQLYLYRSSGPEYIQAFKLTISVVVGGEGGEIRNLAQHTPKRSKDTEAPPGMIIVKPNLSQSTIGLDQNGPAGSMPFSFGQLSQSNGLKPDYDTPFTGATSGTQPPSAHTFERIQFQRATANNGKRRAQQQCYHVVVELWAELGRGHEKPVKIATRTSAPMVVRGRSPGHYKDGRRDSSTSGMGDGGAGPSDGGGGSILPLSIGQVPGRMTSYTSALDQSGSHMKREYRGVSGMQYSPNTTSPIRSSSSSGLEQELDEDCDPVNVSEENLTMDPYARNEYSHPTDIDLFATVAPSNGYHIQLLAPIPMSNEIHPLSTRTIPTLSSNVPRHQTPKAGMQYSRTEYGPSSEMYIPWQSSSYLRESFVGWNGTPVGRYETVNSAWERYA
jgi:meiosis-specific transcription factor NDT80